MSIIRRNQLSGSFATLNSNVFYGLQTITASSTSPSVLDMHAKNDGLWVFRMYNDTYSSSSMTLAGWVDNDGISFFGTEVDKPLYIYANGQYYTPVIKVTGSNAFITGSLHGTSSWAYDVVNGSTIDTSSFATTGSNTFTDSQTIVGNLTFPSSSFISTTNTSGSLYFSSLNNGILYLNSDGGEGDVLVGYNGWPGRLKIRGDVEITGSINFGDGSLIQSTSASSGDGGGYTTLTLKPNTSVASDQYVVLDPTTPNHIHIRAGGLIDSSSAYLYLGGEKANIVVRNLDNSFNEKYWVQINSQTGSTQNTWVFDDNGVLSAPGRIDAPSFSGSFTGSLYGTASYADTASYVALPYAIYTAIFTCIENKDPEVIVLQNTLGVDLTWTNSGLNQTIKLTSLDDDQIFTNKKIYWNVNITGILNEPPGVGYIINNNSDTLQLYPYNLSGSLNFNIGDSGNGIFSTLDIKVFP